MRSGCRRALEIDRLTAIIRALQRHRFGRRAEPLDPEQLAPSAGGCRADGVGGREEPAGHGQAGTPVQDQPWQPAGTPAALGGGARRCRQALRLLRRAEGVHRRNQPAEAPLTQLRFLSEQTRPLLPATSLNGEVSTWNSKARNARGELGLAVLPQRDADGAANCVAPAERPIDETVTVRLESSPGVIQPKPIRDTLYERHYVCST